jgi:hypothetical protein
VELRAALHSDSSLGFSESSSDSESLSISLLLEPLAFWVGVSLFAFAVTFGFGKDVWWLGSVFVALTVGWLACSLPA